MNVETESMKERQMSDSIPAPGGFTGDPTAALTVTGSGGCCGNPPQATLALPDPAAATGACCGSVTDTGSCCEPAAKAEAVASGAGCCG
jgi:hypothetical protein